MGIGDFLQGIVAGLTVREIAGHFEKIAARILERAIIKLTPLQAAELGEAWRSHFEECPTPISELIHALTCWRIAGTWRLEMTKKEYVSWRKMLLLGRLLKAHAYKLRLKVIAVRFLASRCSWLFKAHRRAMMISSAERADAFATIMQQAGACFVMGCKLTIDPAERPKHQLASEWVRLLGLTGGAALTRAMLDKFPDCACIRNAFGWKVDTPVVLLSPRFLQVVSIGQQLAELTTQLHSAMEALNALKFTDQEPASI